MLLKQRLKKNPWVYQVNARIKALAQGHKAAAELRYYRRVLDASKKKLIDNFTLVQAIQQRLAKRGIHPLPKPKGELHIFLAYKLCNWEAVLPKALKPFGLITEFELRSHGFENTFKNDIKSITTLNRSMLEAFHRANNEKPVDVVVGYLSGYMAEPKILQKMGESGAVILNFNWDDKLGFRGKVLSDRWTGPAALAPVVDLNLTNAPESCLKYMAEGGLAMFWPEGAHPEIHKPYDLPFDFDVTFVGQKYGWRPKFIAKLRKKGIQIGCFGYGWDNGPLTQEEMTRLYSRSRINLGFSGVGHSKKLMCLKGRDFEVPMSGGLYLTQDNPELSFVYEIGKEILVYRTSDDCAEKISYILKNPDIAAQIRAAGRKRALRDHSWEKRFEKVFRISGIMV
jgi:spore maturation protein CgeB